jgi:hypothetical protein
MRVVQPLSTAALITSLFLVHTHTSLVRVSGDPSLPFAARSAEALVLRFNSNDGPLLILLFTLVLTLGRPARPAKEREGKKNLIKSSSSCLHLNLTALQKTNQQKNRREVYCNGCKDQLRSWRIFEPASSLIVNNS